jgi:hypothetical protein
MPIRRSSAAAAVSLVLLLALAGCADDGVIYDNGTATTPVSGNWQVSSAGTGTVAVSQLAGSLTGAAAKVTGVLRASSANGCAAATDTATVSGATDSKGVVTMTGPLAGGTLTVTGTLAADGRSLTDASYNVSGGQCAFAKAAQATVQNYSSVTGTYTGNFLDAGGLVMAVTAVLAQSPDGNTDGTFALSGTGTFGQNTCFAGPVTLANSQVTGGSFTLTYADGTTGNTVTADGSFSTDGKTLTVSRWVLTGPCGGDNGTGLLAKP